MYFSSVSSSVILCRKQSFAERQKSFYGPFFFKFPPMKWQWQRKGHEQLKATQLSHANSRLFSKVTRAGRDKVSLNSLLKKKKKKKWSGEGEAELFAANRSMFWLLYFWTDKSLRSWTCPLIFLLFLFVIDWGKKKKKRTPHPSWNHVAFGVSGESCEEPSGGTSKEQLLQGGPCPTWLWRSRAARSWRYHRGS